MCWAWQEYVEQEDEFDMQEPGQESAQSASATEEGEADLDIQGLEQVGGCSCSTPPSPPPPFPTLFLPPLCCNAHLLLLLVARQLLAYWRDRSPCTRRGTTCANQQRSCIMSA